MDALQRLIKAAAYTAEGLRVGFLQPCGNAGARVRIAFRMEDVVGRIMEEARLAPFLAQFRGSRLADEMIETQRQAGGLYAEPVDRQCQGELIAEGHVAEDAV